MTTENAQEGQRCTHPGDPRLSARNWAVARAAVAEALYAAHIGSWAADLLDDPEVTADELASLEGQPAAFVAARQPALADLTADAWVEATARVTAAVIDAVTRADERDAGEGEWLSSLSPDARAHFSALAVAAHFLPLPSQQRPPGHQETGNE